jgi:hypothetical protein
MLVAAFVVLAVLTVPLSHGRWSALAAFRPRAVWMLWLALVVQLLQFTVVDLGPLSDAVHLATYVLAAVFLIANRDIPGLWLIALGGLSNGITIALNGGTLPARATALREAGWSVKPKDFINSGVLAHPKLPWLGDMFAWPAPLPLHNVFSVGDVLLVLGSFIAVHGLARRSRPAVTDEPPAATTDEATTDEATTDVATPDEATTGAGRGRHRLIPSQRSASSVRADTADTPDSGRAVEPATS